MSRGCRADLFLLGIVVGVLGLLLGWWLSGNVLNSPLTVQRYISGRVTRADAYGGAICIVPRGAKGQVCGAAFYQPGTFRLRTGDEVRLAVESLPVGKGVSEVIWVVVSPHP